MKTIGMNPLCCLFVLLILSCNSSKTSTVTTPGNQPEKPTEEVVVAPVVEEKPTTTPEITPPTKEDPKKTTNLTTALESDMIKEINLLRQNPKGYVPFIEEYLRYYENEKFEKPVREKQAAQKLIRILGETPAMQPVKFNDGLYTTAVNHGKFIKQRGNLGMHSPHSGKNGSTLQQRTAALTDIEIAKENFGSSHENPRYQLISLLVDAGEDGSHRDNILDKNMNLAACYNIGEIDGFPGCWLQLLGKEKEKSTTKNNTNTLTLSEATQLIAADNNMTAEEKEMLNEINLFRSNPKAYVRFIERYKASVKNGEVMAMGHMDEAIAKQMELDEADILIEIFKKLEPLPLLKPDKKLYEVAVDHGKFIKQNDILNKVAQNPNVNPHTGKGGLGPNERVKLGANMSRGGENIQSTISPIRETVIGLLVDTGIEGVGHRKTLMNPAWEYGVCHNLGKVTIFGIETEDNWIQQFGKK